MLMVLRSSSNVTGYNLSLVVVVVTLNDKGISIGFWLTTFMVGYGSGFLS